MDDPMERLMRDALNVAGVRYVTGDENPAHLDFYLPDYDVHIEVKQFHSDRISEQMSRVPNVIAAQGRAAVELLARLTKANQENAMGNLFNRIFNRGERAQVAGWRVRDAHRATTAYGDKLMKLREREVAAVEAFVRSDEVTEAMVEAAYQVWLEKPMTVGRDGHIMIKDILTAAMRARR